MGIGASQWLIVVLAVASAYVVLIQTQPLFRTGWASFIPAIFFVGIPLAALAAVAGNGWTALFRRMRAADILLIGVFLVLNWIVTLVVGFISVTFLDAQTNPAGGQVAVTTGVARMLFFGRTGVQLLGEELFTILPFLALLCWLTATGLGRKPTIILGTLVVSVVFALVHLPTYGWNWPHTLVALVPVRIVLLLPYIMTKNIWVSTGVHVLNDWMIFGLPLLLAAGMAGE